MSKQVKRKITVNLSPKTKSLPKSRPSVFERLGTKAGSIQKDYCHHWAQNGTCPYGKNCKYSSTHTLVSPSKQRLAKNQADSKKHHIKDNAHKRPHSGVTPDEWDQWDPEELEDADADDLEKRRLELQRELELQMKMESKAHKKQKKIKKESSPSSDSSSSSSESSSSSDDSSSSSSSSIDTRRKKTKKTKKRDSSSSSERERRKHKTKTTKRQKLLQVEKVKKSSPVKVKVHAKSPTPVKCRKLSQTPPPKIKILTPVKKGKSESKSPRPSSRSSDKKDKHRTPSPKLIKEKEKEREREKEREKEKEKEREREKEKEKEREKERQRQKEREKDKKKERSPKRDSRPPSKDLKKKDSPDSTHSRDRKVSPTRSRGSVSSTSRRDAHKSPPKDRRYEKRPNSRSKDVRKDIRKDKRDSRERERERDRERRIAREEREAEREKEREAALARCQERARERERLKELAKKEEEARRAKERARRDDRGLDKPTSDRVERLLPLPQDRIPPARKESLDKERQARDRIRRSPERNRSRSRKSSERIEKDRLDRSYDRSLERPYEREHDRDYHMRLRDDHRHEDKRYDNSFDRPPRHDDRRYMEMEHYNDDRQMDRVDYNDERRPRRDLWDDRDRELDREMDHRNRYRENSRPPAPGQGLKPRDWGDDYVEHEWDRNRRNHMDWGDASRDNWSSREEEHAALDEEWRHYNRSMDSWTAEERRRWPENDNWRDREHSRPRSSTSHREDEMAAHINDRRKENTGVRQEVHPPDNKDKPEILPEIKKDNLLGKRAADTPVENLIEPKKPCVVEEPLADDLSEISDEADEILNRDEEIPEIKDEPEIEMDKSQDSEVAELKPVQPPLKPNSAPQINSSIKEDSIGEDNMDLDFEEISEDEIEEETRMKGLGDALGVDWASLVAESRPCIKPVTSAKRRWESHNILVNTGISIELAGEELVREIYQEHLDAKEREEKEDKVVKEECALQQQQQENGIDIKQEPVDEIDDVKPMLNGADADVMIKQEAHDEKPKCASVLNQIPIIASMQVTLKQNQGVRKNLFTSVGPFRRALSARRDLVLRRHLCNLPIKDTYVEPPKRYDPELFKTACKLFERSL